MSLLEADNIAVSFGGVKAVQDLSFSVEEGEVFSIVGPNGAGKTTVFNLISRIYDVDHGRVLLDGEDITHVPTHAVARLGIARTFQNTELFEQETVLKNLLIGCHIHRKTNLLKDAFFVGGVRKQELEFRAAVEDVIDLLDLQSYRDQVIGNLAYGVRKMVEVARALCLKPKLLLLDEPSSGLNPEETEDLSFWLEDINEELGITVIMVEHDMNLVSTASDRVLAMADGQLITIGNPADVQNHPEVQRAYLGDLTLQRKARATCRLNRLLEMRNVETYYGPIMAIRGVSMQVQEGSIVSLLGANGAGKTTVLKTISGAMDPQKGTVTFAGEEIQSKDPDWVARLGIGHVPEGREVFPFLTVEENLRMGAFSRRDSEIDQDLELVYEYFPVLTEFTRQPAQVLSGGQQQMLAIGRALMLRPRLMLLDEPSLGLSPRLVAEIAEIIARLNQERDLTVLLVEQNARMALDVGDYGYVMEIGRIVMEDTCERLKETTDIQEFYLGQKDQGVRGRRRWKQRKTWR